MGADVSSTGLFSFEKLCIVTTVKRTNWFCKYLYTYIYIYILVWITLFRVCLASWSNDQQWTKGSPWLHEGECKEPSFQDHNYGQCTLRCTAVSLPSSPSLAHTQPSAWIHPATSAAFQGCKQRPGKFQQWNFCSGNVMFSRHDHSICSRKPS